MPAAPVQDGIAIEQRSAASGPDNESASTQIGAKLSALFPDGVLPPPTAPGDLRAAAAQAAQLEAARLQREGITPNVSGPTGATGPAATGTPAFVPAAPTGPLAALLGQTGATGQTTGPTGASGATGASGTGTSASGATGTATGPESLTQEQKDQLEKNLPVAAGTAFKLIRKEAAVEAERANTAEARNAELEQQIQTLSAQVPDAQKLTDLEAKVAEYEKELSVVRVEATSEFRKSVTEPLVAAETELNAIVAQYNIPESQLRAALNEKDPAKRSALLSDLSANFNRIDVASFDRLTADIKRLEGTRSAILSNAHERAQQREAQQQAEATKAKAKFAADWKGAVDSSFNKLAKELPIFGPTGDATWDAAIAKIRADVKNIDIVSMPNEQVADALYKQQAFKLILGLVTDLHSEKSALEERIARLSGTTPRMGAGEAPSAASGATGVTGDVTFQQVARQALDGVLPR
jgi:hypothetical protein